MSQAPGKQQGREDRNLGSVRAGHLMVAGTFMCYFSEPQGPHLYKGKTLRGFL